MELDLWNCEHVLVASSRSDQNGILQPLEDRFSNVVLSKVMNISKTFEGKAGKGDIDLDICIEISTLDYDDFVE